MPSCDLGIYKYGALVGHEASRSLSNAQTKAANENHPMQAKVQCTNTNTTPQTAHCTVNAVKSGPTAATRATH